MKHKPTAQDLARWRMEKAMQRHEAAIAAMLKSYQFHTGQTAQNTKTTGGAGAMPAAARPR